VNPTTGPEEAAMNNDRVVMRARGSVGDAAVDGLLHGVIAGMVMAIYLIIGGVMTGLSIAATLSAFDLGEGTSPVRGALIHLAVATIYGMLFGSLLRPIERRGHVIGGLVYGLLLWLITQMAFATGVNIAMSGLPVLHRAIAHLVYGVTLGWLAGRAA
jgi:hypothetical protein